MTGGSSAPTAHETKLSVVQLIYQKKRHPKGPGQAWGLGPHKPHEVRQGQVQDLASAHSIHTRLLPFPPPYTTRNLLLLSAADLPEAQHRQNPSTQVPLLFSSPAAKPDISSQHRMRAVFPSASGCDAITQSSAATCGKQKGCGHVPPLCQLWWRGGCTDHPLLTAWPSKTGDKTQGIWTNKLQNTAPEKQCSFLASGRGSEDTAGDCNLFSPTPRGRKLFLHNGFVCTAESYDCKGKPWNKPHLPRWLGQVTFASQHTLLVGTHKIIFCSNITSTKKVTA